MELKLTEGLSLIEKMEDFSINIDTNQKLFNDGSQTYLVLLDQMSVKKYLKLFVQVLIDNARSKTKSDFINSLLRKQHFWQKAQFETISKLNHRIEKAIVPEKKEIQLELVRYLEFFYTIQRIIEFANIEIDLGWSKETNGIVITKFSDILEPEYKNCENDLFSILGKVFPEYYNPEGLAMNTRHNIKAIVNSWYKVLKNHSLIRLNPSKPQKDQICQILKVKCNFQTLTPKTLFDNDGIEVKPEFRAFYQQLNNEIKALKDKYLAK